MPRLVLLLLVAGWSACAAAQADSPALRERIARIENGLREPVAVRGAPARAMRLPDRMRALNVPGVSIAFINRGEIEWTRAHGVADARSGRPVTTSTLFQAASISKPVAAATLMRLAAQGKLDLDEDVNTRLRAWRVPASPLTAQRPVTARALLSHTAGIDATNLGGYRSDKPQPTLLQVLRGAAPADTKPVEAKTTPGSSYAYSSLGYAALQQYLIDAAGAPFDVLARELVLVPLGMRDSLFSQTLPPALAQRAAVGHQPDGTVLPGNWRVHPELAAAGLWTTATDLARFAIAVQRAAQGTDGSFLAQEHARAMLTPVRNDYGLGFELDHAGAEPAFHHSGSNIGYKALLFAYTRTGQGAVVLTNGDHGSTLIEELMRSIAAEYGWEDYRPVERSAAPANPSVFDRLVGDYSVSNVTLRISRKGNALYVAGPPIGPDPAQLVPAGDYEYFLREKDARFQFDANGTDRVQTLTFIDGKPRPGKRLSAASPP